MSWLDKVLPKISRSNGETAKKDIPAGVWTKCSNCGTTLYAQELRDNPVSYTHLTLPTKA